MARLRPDWLEIIAGLAGMTGNATAASISTHDIFIFKSFCFYIPFFCILIGMIIFIAKVKLDEKMHKDIVDKIAQNIKAEDSNN